jgi:predicted acyl esterase
VSDHRRYRFRQAPNSPELRGARARRHEISRRGQLLIERDLEIPTRFGFNLYADLFRPADAPGPVPALLAWTPYGKHDPAPLATIYPASGVRAEWMSDLTIFEAPDPVYWSAHGYAVMSIDIPGVWHARSPATYLSPEEAEAFCDAIEWVGTREWCNGRVGLSGVSYLTSAQWRVAALNPPHLAAINPWEGWSDTYREVVRHGGIPETFFWPYIQVRWGASDHQVEDLWAETREHPFLDDFWRSKAAPLEDIRAPAYVVASWSDHGLHTRGTLEGFRRIASSRKWLEVHGRKKWAHYYDPESLARQRAFFDHFLKEAAAEPAWPPVTYEVRRAYGDAVRRTSSAWPLPETQYLRLHLDAGDGTLKSAPPASESVASYDALDQDGRAVFDHRLAEDTTLVGHMRLHLHVSADSDDMDLFVAMQKLDAQGRLVGFAHYAVFQDGPVALGWLRVSHRELDPGSSTAWLPVLKHQREMKLEAGEIAEVDIEILPSGTLLEAGTTLRLLIAGRDFARYPKPQLYARHEDTVNLGSHRIHTGGRFDSWLQIPQVRR